MTCTSIYLVYEQVRTITGAPRKLQFGQSDWTTKQEIPVKGSSDWHIRLTNINNYTLKPQATPPLAGMLRRSLAPRQSSILVKIGENSTYSYSVPQLHPSPFQVMREQSF